MMSFMSHPPAGLIALLGLHMTILCQSLLPVVMYVALTREKAGDVELTVGPGCLHGFLDALPNLDLSPSVPEMLLFSGLGSAFFIHCLPFSSYILVEVRWCLYSFFSNNKS